MKYTRNAYDLAEEELARRRTEAESERSARIAEISAKAPEIYELHRSLASTNYSMISLIGKGRSPQEIREQINQMKEKNLLAQRTVRGMLESFGYPADYLEYHYHCENCRDTGYKEGVRCQCLEKLLTSLTLAELNSQCSIELRDFSEFRLDFYPDDPASEVSPRKKMRSVYEYCKSYADGFGDRSHSLFLFGRTGLGKTFLSSCIARQLLENGHNVFFGSLLKVLRQIEDERFGRREGATTDILTEAELVILDDLGSEFQTQFTDAVLYEIINERINSGRPTIISTNLSPRELDKKYNDRIVSRLTGCFVPVMFIGSDVRQEKRRMGLK